MNKLKLVDLIALVFITALIFFAIGWVTNCVNNCQNENMAAIFGDEMAEHKQKAIETKQMAKERTERLNKFQDFCGKDNVWEGSWSFDLGVYGCLDYLKVPDSNLN